MIENLVRENIKKLKPYISARDEYSDGILLDANENSLGSTYCENELELNRYPDPHQKDLKNIIGKYFKITLENLFFGVGSDEIIDLLIRIFCEPAKDKIIILDPTYGMYKVACDINNVEAVSVSLDQDFQIDHNLIQKHYDEKVKIIFLCSPNNPTGNLINKKDILKLCSLNTIIVVDEAYMDFAEENSLLKEVEQFENLVVLRTFSKAWGLAGIRLGFCAANPEIIKYLFKVKAPYNINTLTRSAAKNAIENFEKKDQFVKEIIEEREKLFTELNKIPQVEKVFLSSANYILFKIKDAKIVQKKLAEKGIVIRDRSNYNMLENCLRVTIGTKKENEILVEKLKNLYEEN